MLYSRDTNEKTMMISVPKLHRYMDVQTAHGYIIFDCIALLYTVADDKP